MTDRGDHAAMAAFFMLMREWEPLPMRRLPEAAIVSAIADVFQRSGWKRYRSRKTVEFGEISIAVIHKPEHFRGRRFDLVWLPDHPSDELLAAAAQGMATNGKTVTTSDLHRMIDPGEIDWRPTETVPEDFYAF